MQRGEDEVAGLGGGERDSCGLGVAHLADHNHVWSLPERRPQRGREIRGINADFNLFDHAEVVGMFVFDGVFDGYDMAGFMLVDFIDQGGERGGFAGAGCASDDHQAALQFRQGRNSRRKMQLIESRDLGGECADRGGGASALMMQIDAEAPQTLDAIGRIRDLGLAIFFAGMRRQRRQHRGFDFIAG